MKKLLFLGILALSLHVTNCMVSIVIEIFNEEISSYSSCVAHVACIVW